MVDPPKNTPSVEKVDLQTRYTVVTLMRLQYNNLPNDGEMNMKKTLASAVVLLLLSACSKDDSQPTEQTQTPVPQVQHKPLAQELIPNGHWLFNPLHCSKELPSNGVFDLKINEYNLTYINITQSGDWAEIDVKAETHKSVQDYLASDSAKCLGMSKDQLKYARYTAPGTQFDFVLSPKSSAVLMITKEGIYPALAFDEKVLTGYKYVEQNSTEEPLELSKEKQAQTAQDVEYTNN